MWYKISNGYMWVREPNIPSEYQEVEYIESSGTQVIKTWVYMDTTWYRATLEYQNTSTSPSDQAVLWYYMNSEAYAYRTWYWTWNEWFTLSEWGTSLNKQIATWSWTTRTNSNYQFYIFAKQRYDNGNYDSNAYCKLYSCKIYNSSNELIRDFVPCYRKSDNVIWLYDKVGWQFYENQWSWTFTKWSDVEPTYIFVEKQFYPWVPPTPPGPSYTTILDVDFTNTTDSALTSLWFRSIWVNYWLRSETWTWLRWVNYQTDVAAWVEFDYADSLVGKILAWECEVYSWSFQVWWNVNLNISNPRNYSNMSDRYSNLANFWMTWLPWFNSNQYTGVNGWWYWDPTNWSIEWDKSWWLYWDSYWTYHLWLPFTTWTYKMTWSYNFSTWQFTNTWETPNGTLATWTRDFSACTAAQKTIMNNFLATTNKQFILQESRWYWSSSYDVNYWRKLKIKVA